ncbi:hypothetical protein MBRA1_003663 [Malassezia brasiliensis]|uniref:Pre-mRNA-splicing factor 18 n=1 Tax=Malassezia brasiliensis TaxID=1821822 RepID=A0AAF0DX40_9BASI|nr:hypothetical protein MBRA1_003663 [Malassezia brasiliensis]
MEALKAQIRAQKRQAPPAEPAAKYVRRGDLRARTEQPSPTAPPAPPAPPARTPTPPPAEPDTDSTSFAISNEEAIARLRQKNEPIRLFGESDKDRRLRVRALELIEEHGGNPHGRNDFVKLLQATDEAARSAPAATRAPTQPPTEPPARERTPPSQREGVGMHSLLDLGLIRTDLPRVYPMIYYTLKGLLNEWGDTLAQRPEHQQHSQQGRLVTATHAQTREYLKPLFKGLRRRQVAPDVLMRIAEIVHYMQRREYRMANDSYLQLSIGNAPWPIGVTAVGIHERSGQEKLYTTNVAHVLNDEESRKYIQSLKRLMTFAQTKYPPDDISKLMG